MFKILLPKAMTSLMRYCNAYDPVMQKRLFANLLALLTLFATVICHYSWKSPYVPCSNNTAKTGKNQAPFAREMCQLFKTLRKTMS